MENTIIFENVDLQLDEPFVSNPVDVLITLSLDETDILKPVFSAYTEIYDANTEELMLKGQYFDALRKSNLSEDPLFNEIYRLWKDYHLNNLHLSSPAQEEAVQDAIYEGKITTLNKSSITSYLKSIKLYVDENYHYKGRPFVYGAEFRYKPILEQDYKQIKKILALK